MSDYSSVSEDYIMFDTKAPVDYHEDVRNQISNDEMMKHMFGVLTEYDRCMVVGQDARVNPMSGRVTMRTRSGSSFEIPENIQKFAIIKYNEMINRQRQQGGDIGDEEVDGEVEGEVEEVEGDEEGGLDEEVLEEEGSQVSMVQKMARRVRGNKLTMILTIILVLVILYALYKYLNENRAPTFDDFGF